MSLPVTGSPPRAGEHALAAWRHQAVRERFLQRPVGLVGFMGVGKSSVGRELARLLGRGFTDTDADIVERTGRTIPEIFASGEPAFRALELEAVSRALAVRPAQVIALGGGAFAQPACAELLLRDAVVVHLHTPWTVMLGLLDSLAADRPMIHARAGWESQDLYLARAAAYRRAHLRVVVPRHGATEAAQVVARLLRPGEVTQA